MRKSSVKEEIIRCGRDPIYFINKYVRIRHPTRGLIPFKTFPYQDRTLEAFLTKRFNVVLKPRQTGFTEVTSAFIVWLILFHRDISVMVISTKSETAKNVVRRVRTALKNIPRWLLLADIITDNKTSIELSNGSWVKSVSKSADAGRSEALSLLVIDEAAHVDGLDEIWTGLKPTVSAGGRIVMLSTPNGVGNTFHKIYTEALAEANDFNPIRVDWWEHPEHIEGLTEVDGRKTSIWFEKETKGLSLRQIAQEFECEFLASGDTFFMGQIIAWVNGMCGFPISTTGPGGNVHIFHNPRAGGRYIMGCDVATGDGHDSSSFHIFDVDSMEQVAEFDGKLKPDEFAELAYATGVQYNKALIVSENNAVGIAFLQELRKLQYPVLYFMRKGVITEGQVSPAQFSPGDHFIAGVTTLSNNRMLMLGKLEERIRTKKVVIRSERFKTQMETFVWNNSRPEARRGKCDDLIMAAAFAVWVREVLYGTQYNTPEFHQAMLGAMKMTSLKNNQIHGASKNPEFVPARMMGTFGIERPASPYVMRLPSGRYVDIADIVGYDAFGAMVPRRR